MTKTSILLVSVICIIITVLSCSKSDPAAPVDPCANKTIVVDGTVTATSSPASADGIITATATGSSGFTFSLNNGSFQASGTFSGLSAGNYTVTAKDADGCTGIKSFIVNATACPVISITAVITPASGSTANDGSINATATGSTNFTYSLNTGAYQASGNFTGLASGSYTINAKDGNGCIASSIFTVTNATCPTINVTATSTPTSGPAAVNGTITVTASGGTSPYTYSLDGSASTGSNMFSNVSAGNHTIVVTDMNGCLGSVTVNVTSAPCPSITVSLTTTPTSGSSSTGTATITATGGVSPYQYSINSGAYQSSNVFSSLPGGAFTITVRDANGCTATANGTITVSASSTVTIDISSFAYNPSSTTVSVGTIVKWKNLDSAPHTATSDTGVFDTGTLNSGQTSAGYTATTPGVYPYHCLVHGTSMAGTLIVN